MAHLRWGVNFSGSFRCSSGALDGSRAAFSTSGDISKRGRICPSANPVALYTIFMRHAMTSDRMMPYVPLADKPYIAPLYVVSLRIAERQHSRESVMIQIVGKL